MLKLQMVAVLISDPPFESIVEENSLSWHGASVTSGLPQLGGQDSNLGPQIRSQGT